MKNKHWIWNILGTCLISSIVIGGSSTAIWYSATHYTLSNEYGKAYTYRVKMDNFDGDQIKLEQEAKNFSEYLKYKGINTYTNVYPEYINENEAYLNFSLPIEKQIPSNQPLADQDNPIDIPGMTTLFDNINSNRISFIVDLNTKNGIENIPTDNNSASNCYLENDDLIQSDKQLSIPSAKSDSLILNLRDDHNIVSSNDWQNFYQKVIKAQSDSTTNDENITPEIYIIRDKEDLISKMYYILNCFAAHNGTNTDVHAGEFNSFSDGYNFLSNDEVQWASTVFNQVLNSPTKPGGFLSSGSIFNGVGYLSTPYAQNAKDFFTSVNEGGLYPSNVAIPSINGTVVENNDTKSFYPNEKINNDALFYRLIDCTRADISDASAKISVPLGIANDNTKTFGVDWGWNWMEPYLIGIINKDNFTNYFPDKSPTDKNDKSTEKNIGKWIVLGENGASNKIKTFTSYDINLLKKSLYVSSYDDGYGLPYPFTVIRESQDFNGNAFTDPYGNSTTGISFFEYISKNNVVNKDDKLLANGWVISSPILGTIISICIILLLIGIIVSVLYRVPGVLYFLSLIATCSLVILILTLFTKILSLSIFLGIIGMIIVSVASFILIMERMKKHTIKKDFLSNSIKKGATKGLWQTLDLHIVAIIVGVCFLFFGTISSMDFGLTLILGGFISLLMLVIWSISGMLFLWNRRNIEKVKFVFNDKKLDESFVQKEQIIETTFMEYKRFLKFNLFGLKKEVFSIFCVLAVMIAGAILMFTVGVHNSYDFFGGTRICILTSGSQQEILNQLYATNIDWTTLTKEQNFWYLYTNDDYKTVIEAIGGISGIGATYFVEIISPTAMNNDILQLFIAALILSALLSVYALIRLNWTSIIPIFLSSLLPIILLFSVIAITQLYINRETITFIPLFILINTIFSFIFVGNINNKWIKQKYHTFQDLRNIINNEIKSSFRHYFIPLLMIISMIIIVSATLNSSTLVFSFLYLFIGLIVTLIGMLTVTKSVLLFNMIIRYKYKLRINQSDIFFKNNYDDVDEQNIEGINKHKYNRISL